MGLLTLLSACAQAQPLPEGASGWRLGLEQHLMRESNALYRSGTAGERADSASTSALDGALAVSAGRQQAAAWLRLERTRYETLSELDHEAYRARAHWNWDTVTDLSVRTRWQRQRDVIESDLRVDPLSGRRREQTVEQSALELRWGGARPWGLMGRWQRDRVEEPPTAFSVPGFAQTTSGLSLQFRPRAAWDAAIGWRTVRGVREETTASPPSRFDQSLWDTQLRWQSRPGDLLMLSAAAGHGGGQRLRSVHADLRWQATGRLSTALRWWRDEGQQARVWTPLQDLGSLSTVGAADSTVAAWTLQWDLAPRWSLGLLAQRTERSWFRELSLGTDGSSSGDALRVGLRDRVDRLGLQLNGSLARGWGLSCGLRWEDRRDRDAVGGSSAWSYRNRVVDCSLRWGVPPR